ncbi:MAG: glycosyltransferase [Saprospiraceae bacterium]|nr:glycosyltransferase [Saprospiraceae bacterium]
MNSVEISVIVPSYHHSSKLEKCIESLLNQGFDRSFEVIVVDSSTREIQIKVEQICKTDNRVKLIKKGHQVYPGSARNIGIRAASGSIIAFLDADCVADKNWLTNIYHHVDENVILSGVIKNGTPNSILGTCSYLVDFSHFMDLREETKIVKAVPTCNFACKKNLFEKNGYFPHVRAYEDFIFCHNFVAKGGKIIRRKDLVITHQNRTELASICQNEFLLGRFSAQGRMEHDLGPKTIFNLPFLSFFLVAYRFTSILSRMPFGWRLLKYLLYTPLVLFLLGYWSSGFYTGIKTFTISRDLVFDSSV